MRFEEFQKQIVNQLSRELPRYRIACKQVEKVRGQSYTGLEVSEKDSNIACCTDLKPYHERLESGELFPALVKELKREIENDISQMPEFDLKAIHDETSFREQLVPQILPIHGNERQIAKSPNRILEDLVLVYALKLTDSDGRIGTALVTNDMIEQFGMTEEDVFTAAMAAVEKEHPVRLRNMIDVLTEMTGGMFHMEEKSDIWVADMKDMPYGAAVICYPGFLEKAAEQLGGDFYILPSSIHEVILLPDDGNKDVKDLEEMVRGINLTEVPDEDKLSDHVYYYRRGSGRFEMR